MCKGRAAEVGGATHLGLLLLPPPPYICSRLWPWPREEALPPPARLADWLFLPSAQPPALLRRAASHKGLRAPSCPPGRKSGPHGRRDPQQPGQRAKRTDGRTDGEGGAYTSSSALCDAGGGRSEGKLPSPPVLWRPPAPAAEAFVQRRKAQEGRLKGCPPRPRCPASQLWRDSRGTPSLPRPRHRYRCFFHTPFQPHTGPGWTPRGDGRAAPPAGGRAGESPLLIPPGVSQRSGSAAKNSPFLSYAPFLARAALPSPAAPVTGTDAPRGEAVVAAKQQQQQQQALFPLAAACKRSSGGWGPEEEQAREGSFCAKWENWQNPGRPILPLHPSIGLWCHMRRPRTASAAEHVQSSQPFLLHTKEG